MNHHHIITILHKNYNISCVESEIPRLQECADFVNGVLQKIHKSSIINSENTLMVMALLTITDELLDCKNKIINPQNITQAHTQNEPQIHHITPDDILNKLENLCKKVEHNYSALT